MSAESPTPERPKSSGRHVRTAIILAVVLVAVVALTVVLATLTAPDDDSDAAPPTVGAPVIDDQQARNIAEVVTRSMFEISPATSDTQIATFKDNTCGEFADSALPNLVSFTDELKAQNRTSTVTFDSLAVTPHIPSSPSAQVLVAASWQSGDAVNQSRIVYEVIMQNGKTCITKAQFL